MAQEGSTGDVLAGGGADEKGKPKGKRRRGKGEGQLLLRGTSKGKYWVLRYWHDVLEDGSMVCKQKCVKLADYCDAYRCESDLKDLVSKKMTEVRNASKCPHSSDRFSDYVEAVYLPFVRRTMKPSTYAAYKTYFERYIKPWVGKSALTDFTVAIVAGLLKDIARTHVVNTETVGKVRSILSGIFTYAMSEGHFPARSKEDNPASCARIPDELATKPKRTRAATREDVKAILAALKGKPLARAAVGIMAFCGVRPGEARGMRWEEWNRTEKHLAVNRSVWHREVGTTKTEQSERFVTVNDELREILLDLWNAKGSPISGYILGGRKDHPVILDNLAKRVIRPALNLCEVCREGEAGTHEGHQFKRDASMPYWHGWYSLRRFLGTAVRMKADGETMAKALGNSKAVAEKHYLKPTAVLPDVRKAVNDAVSGLIR
jgi:integrase